MVSLTFLVLSKPESESGLAFRFPSDTARRTTASQRHAQHKACQFVREQPFFAWTRASRTGADLWLEPFDVGMAACRLFKRSKSEVEKLVRICRATPQAKPMPPCTQPNFFDFFSIEELTEILPEDVNVSTSPLWGRALVGAFLPMSIEKGVPTDDMGLRVRWFGSMFPVGMITNFEYAIVFALEFQALRPYRGVGGDPRAPDPAFALNHVCLDLRTQSGLQELESILRIAAVLYQSWPQRSRLCASLQQGSPDPTGIDGALANAACPEHLACSLACLACLSHRRRHRFQMQQQEKEEGAEKEGTQLSI